MKVSLNWLADYVELPGTVEELANRLTLAGCEVEGIERRGEELNGIVVAEVVEKQQHPNADKLSVTRVDAGALGTLQVVCGAKNFKVGDRVPLATVGTAMPDGKKIEKAALRGVESFGMLCSAKELGLAEDASGLLILEPNAKLGQPIADALAVRDVVFSLNVTPNRPDWLSHLGVAREIAALTGKPLKLPDFGVTEAGSAVEGRLKVRLEAPERCPRYAARILDGVKLGPSPAWMQSRLRAVGVRAISNAVDVTNFILMELGQPLHAFDYDLVEGHEIVVRTARDGEKMATLDGKERTLTAEDLVIADVRRPSALAGVMGGAVSEVSDKTQRILLESAYFAPSGVRRTARRQGLHSESSHRFERGVDPQLVLLAQDRAAKLLAELCGATVARGRIDATGKLPEKRAVTLRYDRVERLLGVPVAKETTKKILVSLGFGLTDEAAATRVEVPSWRGDVSGEADLVEEVARTQGLAAIPSRMPRAHKDLPPEPRERAVERHVRTALAAAGLNEVVNYSFVSAKENAAIDPGVKPIALKNPISAEQAVMRTNIWGGLLGNLKHSLNRQVDDVRLYELGHVYRAHAETAAGTEAPALETRVVGGLVYGNRAPQQWGQARQPVDFYDAKGAVETVLDAAGVRATFERAEHPALHPRSAANVVAGGEVVGIVGEVHPRVSLALDVPRGVLLFALDFDKLARASTVVPAFSGVPRFTAALRDLAVVVGRDVPAAAVQSEIREAGGALVEAVTLFDDYRGQNLPSGSKSLAFAIRYRAADRTLTDDETNKVHAGIVDRLKQRFAAELRA